MPLHSVNGLGLAGSRPGLYRILYADAICGIAEVSLKICCNGLWSDVMVNRLPYKNSLLRTANSLVATKRSTRK